MVSKTVEFVFQVFLIGLLLLLGIIFSSQILAHAGTATGLVSNTTEEPEEIVETTPHRPLEIKNTDSPDVMIYKLFRNFDPLFLNETDNNKIIYNYFILDLKGNEYGDGTLGHDSNLISMLREGLKNFSYVDEFYQIGRNLPTNCSAVRPNSDIDFYNNDCWDHSIDQEPSTCKIYVRGYVDHGVETHKFKNKIKIRVVWYKTGQTFNDKKVIHTIVALCNDNTMTV